MCIWVPRPCSAWHAQPPALRAPPTRRWELRGWPVPGMCSCHWGILLSSHLHFHTFCHMNPPWKSFGVWVLEVMPTKCSLWQLLSLQITQVTPSVLTTGLILSVSRVKSAGTSAFSMKWGSPRGRLCFNQIHLGICGGLSVENQHFYTHVTVYKNVCLLFHHLNQSDFTTQVVLVKEIKPESKFLANFNHYPYINLNRQ